MKEENLDIYECLDFMQLWYRDVLLYKVARDMNQLILRMSTAAPTRLVRSVRMKGWRRF